MTLNDINIYWARSQFNVDARLRIYRKLSSLLSNSVPMLQALETLHKQASKNGKNPSDPVALALRDWIMVIRNGESLSVAMGSWVPFQERMLISAGENSGSLEKTMLSVCDVIEGGKRMSSAVMGGVIYPLILFSMALATLWMFGVKVIPAFSKVSNPATWTGVAKSMYIMSEFVKVWTIPSVIVIIVTLITLYLSMPKFTGSIRVALDKFPPWSIYRLWVGSGFIMSLSALVKSGIPLEKALIMLNEGSGPWMKERLDKTIFGLRSGLNLGSALDIAGHGFPDPEIIDDITIYANLSGFDKAIELIGNQWLKKGVETVETQAKVMNGIAMLLMGVVTAWIAMGLYGIQEALTVSIQSR